MRGTRTIATTTIAKTTVTHLLVAAVLVVAGTLAWTGCGSAASSGGSVQAISGLNPFVAASALTKETAGTNTTVGDVSQTRDLKDVATVEASDPRASGTLEVIINADVRADGSGTMWGSCVLTNDKGTWVCDKWTGAIDAGTVNRFVFIVGKGTGAYEGLTLYWQEHFAAGYTTMLPPSKGYAVSGWIQKTE